MHGTGLYIYVDIGTVFSLSYFPHLCKSFKSFKILVLPTSISIATFSHCYIPYLSDFCFAAASDTEIKLFVIFFYVQQENTLKMTE